MYSVWVIWLHEELQVRAWQQWKKWQTKLAQANTKPDVDPYLVKRIDKLLDALSPSSNPDHGNREYRPREVVVPT